jgi:hypothetical protein
VVISTSLADFDLQQWAVDSREQARSARPHTFFWCVGRFWIELGGQHDPMLTAIARAVCERWAVWPEHLVGREAVGDALIDPNMPPPHGVGIDSGGWTCYMRHWTWWIVYELTDHTYDTIGRIFGNRQAETVSRVVRRRRFFAPLNPGVKEWILHDEILPRIDRVLVEVKAQPRTTTFNLS